ncbi:hypothetical protein DPMN_100336 [Dreissena polymorpha]|uniref:Uncharacterized protein n=1 Tax=Dreissena polymorpha TaxID=45954 RepID=A0A9D4LFR8_DREPO|nr:hypothetical protein DPMN_100336 [Dreissena polymorpha]
MGMGDKLAITIPRLTRNTSMYIIQQYLQDFAHLRGTNTLFHDPRQNCPPPSSHVIQRTRTIFELNSRIKETNVLIEKNAPPTGSHVFSPIPTIFKLVRDINKTNFHFHDDWAKIVTSRVLTRITALPTGGHVLQRIGTTFELNQYIIKTIILTNDLVFDPAQPMLLTKFHEDGTRNVTSRVFTSKCLRKDGHTMDKDRSEKLT